ncbi:MAG: hypothetical protein ACRCX8_05090 [Sarcina sp.]
MKKNTKIIGCIIYYIGVIMLCTLTDTWKEFLWLLLATGLIITGQELSGTEHKIFK